MPFNDSGSAFGPGGGSPVRQLANLWLGKQFLGGDRDRSPSGDGRMKKRDYKNLQKYQEYMYGLEDQARRRAAGTHVDAYGKVMDIETQHLGQRGQMETEELGKRGAAETEEHGKRTAAETQAYAARGETDVSVHGRKTEAETAAQRERMDINVGGEKTSLENQASAIFDLAKRRQDELGGPQFPQTGPAPVDEATKKKRSEAAAKGAKTRADRRKAAEEAGESSTTARTPRPRKEKTEKAPVARPTQVRQEEPTLMGGAPGHQRGSIGGAVQSATYEYDKPKKD